MATVPPKPRLSSLALEASWSLTSSSERTVYAGTPCAPRAVISRAIASSARRRVAGFLLRNNATTFAPCSRSGSASGARQVDSNVVVEQASGERARTARIGINQFRVFLMENPFSAAQLLDGSRGLGSYG